MFVLRRIRGLVAIATVWGVALAAIGTAFILAGFATGWISHIAATSWTQWVTLTARVAARDFLLGAASGTAFGMLLATAERRRTIDSLSLRRVGVWGFLASALPIGVAGVVSGAVIAPAALAAGTIASGFVGAGLGIAMLRVARRTNVSVPADASQAGVPIHAGERPST